jgi:uncharacterized protein
VAWNAQTLEDEKVASAIKTDFILSAEIMAITLASVSERGLWMQTSVLVAVGIGITVLVYGGVALIVKADDVGVALARAGSLRLTRALGRGLVLGMPVLLKMLSVVGTAAMIWVGGGLVVHGMELYGVTRVGPAIHDLAAGAGHALPLMKAAAEWMVTSAGYGVLGLLIGAAAIPLVGYVLGPAWKRISSSH